MAAANFNQPSGSTAGGQGGFRRGSSGGGGAIEARIARLESDVRSLMDKVDDNQITLARMEERLNHTPTTIKMVAAALGIIAAMIGTQWWANVSQNRGLEAFGNSLMSKIESLNSVKPAKARKQ